MDENSKLERKRKRIATVNARRDEISARGQALTLGDGVPGFALWLGFVEGGSWGGVVLTACIQMSNINGHQDPLSRNGVLLASRFRDQGNSSTAVGSHVDRGRIPPVSLVDRPIYPPAWFPSGGHPLGFIGMVMQI